MTCQQESDALAEPTTFSLIPRRASRITSSDGGLPHNDKVPSHLRDIKSGKKPSIAAVVSHTTWTAETPEPDFHRLQAVDGTTQEAEAIGLLVQLQEILADPDEMNWVILD